MIYPNKRKTHPFMNFIRGTQNKPKVININFPDHSHEIVEANAHKKFIASDLATESNKPLFSLLQNIGIGFVIAFLLTFGVAVLVYNDAPTWIWSVVILFMLCVISVSWTIVRSARKG